MSPPETARRHYAMWMFTGACPSRCVYCDIQSQQGRSGLTRAEVERVSREILENGFSEVLFVGGEPLLSPDLPAALAILKGRVPTAVFTGGLPGLAERAVSVLGEGGVNRVVLSIDSGDEEHNDRIRGRKGITRELLAFAGLAKERLPGMGRSVNTVVSRENVATLGDVWDRMRGFGLDSWALTLSGDSFEGARRTPSCRSRSAGEALFRDDPAPGRGDGEGGRGARRAAGAVSLARRQDPACSLVRARERRQALAARTSVLAELELYSRGEHNATFVRRHGCPLVGKDVVIGVGGEIHPCSQAPIIHPRWVVGNIKSQPLSDILSGAALRDFEAHVPHAPCTRCWAPSNVPRDVLVTLLAKPRTP